MSLNTLDGNRRQTALIEELIADPSRLGPDFQPIRKLEDLALVGVKATGRGQAGTELADTLSLLNSAHNNGQLERLDWAFRCLAFDAMQARKDLDLYLTPEVDTYGRMCPPRLTTSFMRGRRDLRVFAEVPLEAFDDLDKLRRAVDEFRGWGWRIVTRDVADSSAAVDALSSLRPDVVMVDLDKPGRGRIGSAPGVEATLELARTTGATVLALGVDSDARRNDARDLGATLGRGRSLGEPGPLPL